MSRMAIPTMDVVRFKEEDVIVASGHMTAQFSGLGDSTSRNAFLEFLNGEKVERNFNDLEHLVDESFKLDFNDGTETKSLSDLVKQDKNDDGSTHSSFNGTYKKDENGLWRKQ